MQYSISTSSTPKRHVSNFLSPFVYLKIQQHWIQLEQVNIIWMPSPRFKENILFSLLCSSLNKLFSLFVSGAKRYFHCAHGATWHILYVFALSDSWKSAFNKQAVCRWCSLAAADMNNARTLSHFTITIGVCVYKKVH